MTQTARSNESESSETRKSFSVTLEKGEDGWITAICSKLNIASQGKTYKDAEKNIIEAIELDLEIESKEFSIAITRLSYFQLFQAYTLQIFIKTKF